MSEEQIKNMITNDIKNIAENTDDYVSAGMSQLAYIENPTKKAPIYETLTPENIYYLPIDETNEYVSIYKQYKDINGEILRDNDKVTITTTILSKKANNKLTYIDQIK